MARDDFDDFDDEYDDDGDYAYDDNPLDVDHPYPGDEDFQEWYESLTPEEQDEFDAEFDDTADDDADYEYEGGYEGAYAGEDSGATPEWWQDDMPDEWFDFYDDSYEIEEWEFAIDY